MTIRILSILAAIGSYLMLLSGTIVSKTGSGEGCGNSWPFCQGELFPDTMPVAAIIEYSHRILSSFIGIVILLLFCMVYWRVRDRQAKLWAILSFCSVILQGTLGALTVKLRSGLAHPIMLSLHFGFALICLASVVLLMLRLSELRGPGHPQKIIVPNKLKILSYILLVYTYLVVYTGALVRHMDAIMGCGYSVFSCEQTYFPNFYSQAGVQLLHRYAACVLLVSILLFCSFLIRRYKIAGRIVFSSWLAIFLIIIQVLSGILTILSGGQLLIALLHTTIISILFAVLVYICVQLTVRR